MLSTMVQIRQQEEIASIGSIHPGHLEEDQDNDTHSGPCQWCTFANCASTGILHFRGLGLRNWKMQLVRLLQCLASDPERICSTLTATEVDWLIIVVLLLWTTVCMDMMTSPARPAMAHNLSVMQQVRQYSPAKNIRHTPD